MFFVPSPPYVVPTTMIDVIKHLGLTSGLKLCLDAGDANSYSGSGQVWSDLSGGGYHFNRGADSSAGSDDPTFNGVAGRQSASEYWSFDGGDEFRLAQSNPTWIENLHKNNAKYTFAAWVYVKGGVETQTIFATADSTADVGCFIPIVRLDGQYFFELVVNNANANGSNTTAFHPFSGIGNGSENPLSLDAWNFISLSYDEPSGVLIFWVNNTTREVTGSPYVNPSSAAATFVARMGMDTASPSLDPVVSGTRFNSVAMWDTALTAAQLSSLYNATKAKFGH
jgi:hypothetical protein